MSRLAHKHKVLGTFNTALFLLKNLLKNIQLFKAECIKIQDFPFSVCLFSWQAVRTRFEHSVQQI